MKIHPFEAFNINSNLNFYQNPIHPCVQGIKSEPIIPDHHVSDEFSVQLPMDSDPGKYDVTNMKYIEESLTFRCF